MSRLAALCAGVALWSTAPARADSPGSAAALAGSAQAGSPKDVDDPSPWRQVAHDSALTVWERDVPGGRVKAVKSAGLIDAPPAAVFAVLRDLGRYSEIMPYTKVSRVLDSDPAAHADYFYTVVDAPLVAMRDYTLKVTVDKTPPNPEDGYLVSWVTANGFAKAPPPQPGVVRLDTVKGSWSLRPFAAGKTYAVYKIFTDPGGAIPPFLVDKANAEAVGRVFETLRTWSKRAPYNVAK